MHRLFIQWCVLVPVLACGWFAESGLAQESAAGMIHGQVRGDASSVIATGLDNGLTARAAVLRDGTFLLPGLAPGEYRLGMLVGGVLLEGGGVVRVGLGATAEVTVQPVAGALQMTTVREPETSAILPPDEDDDGLLSLRGLRPEETRAVVDGVDTAQSLGGVPAGSGSDPAPDAEDDGDSAERTTGPTHGLGRGRHGGLAYGFAGSSIREFRVVSHSYSAAAGGAGGTSVRVTRSGGENYHGSFSLQLRSSALAARDPLAIATNYADGIITSNVVKPHDLRTNFGLALGGLVPRVQKTRFFYAFEEQRRGFPAISTPVDANFYALTGIQRGLLATRGVSAAATNRALNYVSSLTGETPRRADQTVHFGRLDWAGRAWLRPSIEYNRVRWESPAGLLQSPTVARGRASLGDAAGSLDQILLRLTTEAGDDWRNQVALSLQRDLQYERPQPPLPGEPAIGPGGFAPEVNIGPNGLLFGTPAGLSKQAYPDEQRMQIVDTASLVRGHHLLEIGGTLAFVHEAVATLGNAAGTFRYESGETRGYAGGLVDFITDQTFNVNGIPNGGCPSIHAPKHLFCFRSYTQSFGEESVAFNTRDVAGFAQDTWRPGHGLLVQAGVRYEYSLLPFPQKPNGALDAIFRASGATSIFPEDRNNVAPRLSVTAEPVGRGRGTIRAGYGIFYGRLPGETIRAALSDTALAGSTTRVRILPSTETGCPQVVGQGFGYPCSFTAQPGGVVATTTSAVVFARNFRLPMVQQASLQVARSLGRGSSLSAEYVLNLDRQLTGSTDLNILPATRTGLFQLHGGAGYAGLADGQTFRLPVYTGRVSPAFGPVTAIVSRSNAVYHGVVIEARIQPVSALLLRTLYTWSQAVDFGQSLSATPRTNGQFDPFTNGYDKGLSALNFPQTMRGEVAWSPVLGGGERWLHGAVNGWRLQAIATARSGRGYSYDLSGGTRLPGGHLSLNGSGGALYLPTVGRNTLRLPAMVQTDLRVQRGLRLYEKARGVFWVEAFNLLNHQTINSVNQRAFLVGTAVGGITPLVFQDAHAIAAEGLNVSAFGTPNGSGSNGNRERQVEVGMRVFF